MKADISPDEAILSKVPICLIYPNPNQPRKLFDPVKLEESPVPSGNTVYRLRF